MNLRRVLFAVLILLPLGVAAFLAANRPAARVLRVCADPNNMPFSNSRQEGLENRLAELLADELEARVEYTWWAQRRGFIRNTLRAGRCDVVMGVPSSFELALTTRPYYRSTYVFATRAADSITITSLDDPGLRQLRIGVQLVGDDGANTPPAHSLANRGIVDNVTGYTVYGDYSKPNPPARILDALVRREIDVAIVWGPLAGWYAHGAAEPLALAPVLPQIEPPFLPMVFDISLAVRREDTALAEELEAALAARQPQVDGLLEAYGVPVIATRRRSTR